MTELREFLSSKLGLAVCLLLAALGVYLIVTHTGHVLSAIPYVILLACPLLHLFGHGHGHGHRKEIFTEREVEKSPTQHH
jgi:uncharacterized membrane protein